MKPNNKITQNEFENELLNYKTRRMLTSRILSNGEILRIQIVSKITQMGTAVSWFTLEKSGQEIASNVNLKYIVERHNYEVENNG